MKSTKHIEDHLIGAALKKPELLSVLAPTDFTSETSRVLWRALRECRNKFQVLDIDIVSDYLYKETGADLTEHLHGYLANAPETDQLIEHYAKIVIESTRKAKLDSEVNRIAELELPVDDKIASLNSVLKLVQPRSVKPLVTMKSLVRDAIEHIELLHQKGEMPGVKSGLPKFDQLTGGFQDGDLYILAARPSVGKTAFAINMALAINNCAFVSAEQPANQVIQRLFSIKSGIPAHKMRNPRKFTEEEWTRLTPVTGYIANMKMQIYDESAPTIEEIRYWSMKAVDRGAKAIIIDYLQRIKAADRSLSTFDKISHVAQSMKEIARSLKVPVISLAQINRQGAQDPRMEHLKGSGDIEQEADMVIILNRDLENDQSMASLNIEKNRHGPITDINLYFDQQTMRFSEPSEYDSDYSR